MLANRKLDHYMVAAAGCHGKPNGFRDPLRVATRDPIIEEGINHRALMLPVR
jgi:hypothetical protein